MFKNVATKLAIFAFDTTTGAPKTGDAANLTAYVSKDYGSVTALADTSATEMDATNAKGWYLFDVAQSETNADALLFSGKSSTANIALVGQLIFTTPANFSSFSINGSGQVDAIKLAGQTITAAAGVTFPSSVASPTNITGGIITTVTNLTNSPTSGDLTATMKTSVATAVLTTAMTESYAANGAAPTLAQALFMNWSTTANGAVAGTTLTNYKLDGSTTAMTFTLNSATTPTSITRAT